MKKKLDDPKLFLCGSPGASRKHHLFYGGDVVSVCKKWMYTGTQYVIDDKFPFGSDKEDCAPCARVLKKAQGAS